MRYETRWKKARGWLVRSYLIPHTSYLFLLLLCGCTTTRVVVIPADKNVIPMPAGKAFTPDIPGYFVPSARMQEILERGLLKTNALPR